MAEEISELEFKPSFPPFSVYSLSSYNKSVSRNSKNNTGVAKILAFITSKLCSASHM